MKEEVPAQKGMMAPTKAVEPDAAQAQGARVSSEEAAEAPSSAVLPDILDFDKIYRLGMSEAAGDASSISVDVRDIISIQHSISGFILNNAT